jgi:hypothetical protein
VSAAVSNDASEALRSSQKLSGRALATCTDAAERGPIPQAWADPLSCDVNVRREKRSMVATTTGNMGGPPPAFSLNALRFSRTALQGVAYKQS